LIKNINFRDPKKAIVAGVLGVFTNLDTIPNAEGLKRKAEYH
jgi:hypothetical protein